MPPGDPAELDDGRGDRGRGEDLLGGAGHDGPAVAGDEDHPVGVLRDPLEPVLGEEDGEPEVVHQPLERGEDLLGGERVERRGGLVEHEDPRVRGQHRADGDPLLLAAGEAGQRPVAQVGQAEQVEGLLDALAHHVGRQPERLHAVGELVLHGVGDEAGERVLPDVADDVGEVAGTVLAGVPAVDDDAAGEGAAGEVRHQPVDGAQQRGLAGPGAADHEDQLALGDGEVDVVEHRPGRVGEPDAGPLERDHAATFSVGASWGLPGRTTGSGGARKAGSIATRMPAQAITGTGGTMVTEAR